MLNLLGGNLHHYVPFTTVTRAASVQAFYLAVTVVKQSALSFFLPFIFFLIASDYL